MKKQVYYCGEPPIKYGMWNTELYSWCPDICEDTPMLAVARLFQKFGEKAKALKCEPRKLPKQYWRNDDE